MTHFGLRNGPYDLFGQQRTRTRDLETSTIDTCPFLQPVLNRSGLWIIILLVSADVGDWGSHRNLKNNLAAKIPTEIPIPPERQSLLKKILSGLENPTAKWTSSSFGIFNWFGFTTTTVDYLITFRAL